MPLYKVEKTVDLTILPTPRSNDEIFEENTIGDLHANAIKLIYTMVEIGLLRDFSQRDYDQLIKIYNSDLSDADTARANLNLFKSIVEQMNFNPTPMKLRLIGDELSDRGACDWFILLIISKLSREQIDLEILISNHSMEFLYNFERKKRFDNVFQLPEEDQRCSANNLQKLIDLDVLALDEVEALVKEHYLPKLKLFAYTKGGDFVSIYTHAPIGLNKIKLLFVVISGAVPKGRYVLDNMDACNDRFQQEYVQKGRIHFLRGSTIFSLLLWNREEKFYRDRPTELETTEGLKESCFINGHDSEDDIATRYHICTDTELGKGDLEPGVYILVGYRAVPILEKRVEIIDLKDLSTTKQKTPSLPKVPFLNLSTISSNSSSSSSLSSNSLFVKPLPPVPPGKSSASPSNSGNDLNASY